jgi:hypothetical protein
MSFDDIPLWVLFVVTMGVVMASIEVGLRAGRRSRLRSRDSEEEKEGAVSGMSGAILGLTAFILAFTFSLVGDRYDTRKELVREDAIALRTAWLRADVLPTPVRDRSRALLREYLDLRVRFVQQRDLSPEHVRAWHAREEHLQRELWILGMANVPRDDIGAMYIESLGDVARVDALRVAISIQSRVPGGVWAVLYVLTILGMISIGYHTGIAGSKRSQATIVLALAFATVIIVIAMLDRPGDMPVSQQPLIDAGAFMARGQMRSAN